MSALSDQIEAWLKAQLDAQEGSFRFTRSELAEDMNCAPSQITYVLSTRFRSNQGYIVESRRGGGGSILLRRVRFRASSQFIMHTVNSLGDSLSPAQARIILQNLRDAEIIDGQAYALMKAAAGSRTLQELRPGERDALRARILGSMLLALIGAEAGETEA